jgi:cytochrome b561
MEYYNRVARGLHWLVALLAVGVVGLGWASETAARGTPGRDFLLLSHRSVGLTILALMLVRLWWRWGHPPPPLPAHVGLLERALAGATHVLLYVVLIAMPLAGWVNAVAAGHEISLFGAVAIPPLLPEDDRLSQVAIAVHLTGQYVLYLLVSLHLAGAALHAIVRRDGVVGRMLTLR